MAKGLLPDTASAMRRRRALHRAEGRRRRDADRRAPQLAAVARQGQDLGRSRPKKFIQIDIEPREMDSNVEIAAPAGRRHRLLRRGAARRHGRRLAGAAGRLARRGQGQARRERRQDGAAADEQQLADGLSRRARRAAHHHQGAARRHPGQRRRQHARPRARRHRHVPAAQAARRRHLGRHGHRHGLSPIAAAVETGKPVLAVEGDSAFGFSGMEVETICRYNLPVCVVIFNNDGIYRGTDVNPAAAPIRRPRCSSRARATTR